MLDTALHLHGLRGLVAETLDEGLRVLYLPLLVLPGPELLLPAFLAQPDELVILHPVVVDASAGDFDGAGGDVVEEGSVVADQDDGVGPCGQELLQPLYRLDVQVVGRLVQQEHVGPAQEELGQLDAHAPPAGELARGPVEVCAGEAQPLERALRLRPVVVTPHQVVAVGLVRELLDKLLVLRRLVVRTLGQLLVQACDAVAQLVDVCESQFGLLHHRPLIAQHHHLGQIAYGALARHADRARRGRLQSGQNLEHGGLAGPVLAHQGDAVLTVDDEAHVLEQRRGIELYG